MPKIMNIHSKSIIVCLLILAAACPLVLPAPADAATAKAEVDACVILLHGLCRSGRSMLKIKQSLEAAGYAVINLDYASTRKSIEIIAETDVAQAVACCRRQGFGRIHFVTHSLGGLVVRAYLQEHQLPAGSRVVMLAPPNHGSELADTALAHMPGLYSLIGPAAGELATRGRTINNRLKPVAAEIGIIAGDLSFNPVFSHLLPGRDDSKVAVESTRLPEMRDFIVMRTNHTLILWDQGVIQQILNFLAAGSFAQ